MATEKFIVHNTPATWPDAGPMVISLMLHTGIVMADKSDWSAFFQNFRLSFRSRILGCQGDDLLKLQGKLEAVNEIEAFINEVLSSSPERV